MKTVGIICEYNPLHLGHRHQFEVIRQKFGPDTAIVCLMSGNYVQRGAPAIFDKSIRAEAAVRCGADLVLEMPIGTALSSAEGFASGSVAILSRCCDVLCFGAESMEEADLRRTAEALLSPEFSVLLKEALGKGLSFPAARQAALEQMGIPASDLALPNNILAVEYCKAILAQGSHMEIFPIPRQGDYHAEELGSGFPSATAIRQRILEGRFPGEAIPPEAARLFREAPVHTLAMAARAILAKLRTMTDEEFEALPYGSEGLWRKLMKAARSQEALEDIINATKSKRYTRTRIDRMILCAFLGLTARDLQALPPYTRILAFNSRGRSILREHPEFRNAGEAVEDPYWLTEQRCGRLYGLFRTEGIDPPDLEKQRRVKYLREDA